jgi:pyrimidine deaminase RibD-like protein
LGESSVEPLGGGVPAQDLAWTIVAFGGHGGQVLGGVHAEVAAVGEVLAEQAVRVSLEPRCHGLAGSQT